MSLMLPPRSFFGGVFTVTTDHANTSTVERSPLNRKSLPNASGNTVGDETLFRRIQNEAGVRTGNDGSVSAIWQGISVNLTTSGELAFSNASSINNLSTLRNRVDIVRASDSPSGRGVTVSARWNQEHTSALYELRRPDGEVSASLLVDFVKRGSSKPDAGSGISVLVDPAWDITSSSVVAAINLGIGMNMLGTWVGMSMAHSKRAQRSNGKQAEEVQRDCSRLPNDGHYRMSHDMLCTLSPIVTLDGRMYLTFLCTFGTTVTAEINVLECCKKHDIAMWCAASDLEVIIADQAVIACVTARFARYVNEDLTKDCFPFLHDTGGLLGDVLEFIIGLPARVLGSIEVIVGGVLSSLGAILFAWWQHETPLKGYGGINKDSCLCGGTVPTVLCDDECRNLCKEMGKSANCRECKPLCDYRDGKAVGWKGDDSPDCCPGSSQRCYKPPMYINKRKLNKECIDKCYDCYYECDICWKYHWKFCPNPGKGMLRLLTDPAGYRPCCSGTPKPIHCPTGGDRGEDPTSRNITLG